MLDPCLRVRRNRIVRMKAVWVALLGAALCSSACRPNSTPTATSPISNTPVVVETYSDVLPLGGAVFYSFSVPVDGEVLVTLLRLEEDGAPSAALIGMAIGRPAGVGCSTSAPQGFGTSVKPNIQDNFKAGVYCVRINDFGNLHAPGNFSINIARPR